MNKLLDKLMPKGLKSSMIRKRLRLKEKLRIIGEMDYPNARILMNVDTLRQLSRLNACKKEPETVNWLHWAIKPGDVFYDVGANVGAYSFVAYAVANRQCQVYSFEPSFSTYAALSENVFLNKASGAINPMHLALGDKTDLLMFNYFSLLPGAAMHGLEEPVTDEGVFEPKYKQPVLSYRMDDLIQHFHLPLPTVLKVDVDGSELKVIQGAENTLAQPQLRTVLIELNEKTDNFPKVMERMAKAGLTVKEKHQRGQTDYYNYIFHR